MGAQERREIKDHLVALEQKVNKGITDVLDIKVNKVQKVHKETMDVLEKKGHKEITDALEQ